jgi:NAD(P)-dependent dehydrogenase (short-subunit alcohol dehydrogenase family)
MVMTTVLVTGGSRSLGRATAEKLAVVGHRVILVARNPAAAEAAAEEILRSHSDVRVEARSVDLSSLAQARAFATTEAERGEPSVSIRTQQAVTAASVGKVPRQPWVRWDELRMATVTSPGRLGVYAAIMCA